MRSSAFRSLLVATKPPREPNAFDNVPGAAYKRKQVQTKYRHPSHKHLQHMKSSPTPTGMQTHMCMACKPSCKPSCKLACDRPCKLACKHAPMCRSTWCETPSASAAPAPRSPHTSVACASSTARRNPYFWRMRASACGVWSGRRQYNGLQSSG